jgi:hypothetical protein
MVISDYDNRMEAVKLFDKKKAPVDWEYDGEADTLYISFGKPSASGIAAWRCSTLECRQCLMT